MLAQVQVFGPLVLGPFGPDLGPDLDLTWDLDLDLSLTISGDTPDPLPVASRVDIELERWEKLPLVSVDDPMDYFRENPDSFDILRKIAADTFPIPAASSSSERAFSAATRVSALNLCSFNNRNFI